MVQIARDRANEQISYWQANDTSLWVVASALSDLGYVKPWQRLIITWETIHNILVDWMLHHSELPSL